MRRFPHPVRLVLALVALAAIASVAVAEPAPPLPPEPKNEIKFKPGSGFTLVNGEDFTLQVTGRIQARWTWTNFDDDLDLPSSSSFTAERVRFGAKGTMFKDWKYEFQADFGKGATTLRDAAITWERTPDFAVTAGQYKVRYDRQNYVSSGRQMFADRSDAARNFGLSRDIGLMLSGAPFSKKFQWNAGMFDGQATPAPADPNMNDGHLYVARVSFNPNGDFGLSESDIKKSDYHLWYIDLAGYWNNDLWKDANADKKESDDELTDTDGWTFGFGYKHAGAFLSGEYFDRSTGKDDGTGEVDSDGWYLQFGYMIVRDSWEIAARWSEVDPKHGVDDDVKTEMMLGFNKYFKKAGHSLKLNNDISWIETEKVSPADDLTDFRVRSQLQIVF